MKKNICLVTWGNSVNYGTCIQCYALAEYLRKEGYNVVIPDSYKHYYGINHPIETIGIIKDTILNKFSKKNDSEDIFKKRRELNTRFAYDVTKIISINSKTEFDNMISNCDIFISGSDQIWNPYLIRTPMMLSFVADDKLKIAYGSSMGVSELPKNKINLYKKYLNRYNFIGLREETAKKIISEFSDIDTQVVLDPSFLLDKADWEKIAVRPDYVKEDDEFVFGYFIGNNKRAEKEICDFLEKNHLKMIYAISESNIRYSFGEGYVDMGVEEFLWCILNAKYIITDSFHAVALSINFNKNFFVYKRFIDNDKKSQNSRIVDIINKFDLNEIFESSHTQLENMKDGINYNMVNNKLNELKKDSYNFLNKALGAKNG